MNIINTVLGVPLGHVIYFAYGIFSSYGLAIVAFAIIVKIVLFPVTLLAHRNSIRLLQLQPSLHVIKQRYAGDKDGLNEAQYELFAKEKYSPLVGILPLLAQLFLVIGMLQVMYHPLQHILRLDSSVIESLVQEVGATGFAPQLQVLEAVPLLDLQFLGLNLGIAPSLVNPSIELVVVLLSGLVAFMFCLVQNAISPGALSQSKRTNIGLTIFTVGLSVYFALALPVGVGLYWTVGNFAAIGVVLLLNLLFPPKKLATEALAHLQSIKKTPEQLHDERLVQKELKTRENTDAARFNSATKQLVFYALSGAQFRYYKNIIDYLLEHSDIVIHYLTNDPNDSVFHHSNKKVIPYYAGHRRTIVLMLNLNTDIFVTTVPDLQTFHMKRSIKRDDIEYIFIPHTLASVHVMMKETFCDHFNTVFCVGPHQTPEIRRREEYANLPRKKLVKAGYGLYDTLKQSYKELQASNSNEINEKPKILIAPSWQTANILDLCIDDILTPLLGKGFEITVRPHPQYTRLYPERMNTLRERYSQNDDVKFGMDTSDNSSVFSSDIVITDWSNIAPEFAYCTHKPCVFVNTPMKILNPNYEKLGLEITDLALRNKIGISVDLDKLNSLHEVITELLEKSAEYEEQILQAKTQYLYHPGRNGEAGGRYLIQQIQEKSQIKGA